MKFPGTKREFDAWWKGKKDNGRGLRHLSCPIARFLAHKGSEKPRVSGTWYSTEATRLSSTRTNLLLPKWARDYVKKFDEKKL